jgi:hypothetical protein
MVSLMVTAWGLFGRNLFVDGDPYWHIAVGRWIAEHHSIPTTEFYSFSMPGIPWTAHEWLAELLMYALYSGGGWPALHVAVTLCFAFTAGYITRFVLARMEPIYAIALSVVCIATVGTHFMGRPHVFAWPFIAIWVGTLVTAVERQSAPPLWLLILVPFWTNLHASFTLALGFAGALALEAVWAEPDFARRRAAMLRWAPFLTIAALCVLINPRGVYAITHAVGVMKMKKTLDIVSEWRSADFHEFQFFTIWLFALMAAALLLRPKVAVPRAVFLIGLTYLALKHQRYHSLAGLVSPFLLAAPIGIALRARVQPSAEQSASLDRIFQRLAQRTGLREIAVASLSVALVIPLSWNRVPYAPDPSTSPNAALAAFRATGAQGRVLNSYGLGGYLIFKGIPVYIDGRGDMYGDEFMEATSDALGLRKPHAFEAVLATYNIGWTLISAGTPAIELLDHLPDWQRIYGDSVAVVHVRRDSLAAAQRRKATITAPASPPVR